MWFALGVEYQKNEPFLLIKANTLASEADWAPSFFFSLLEVAVFCRFEGTGACILLDSSDSCAESSSSLS